MNRKPSVAAVLLVAALAACSSSVQVTDSPQVTSSPLPLASSTPTATSTPGATGTPAPTTVPTLTVTTPPTQVPSEPAPTTTPAAPSEPPMTPDPSGWVPPALIAEGRYLEVSLVMDGNGAAHVAAQGSSGIWHLTNAGGSWTRERLTTTAPHEVHDSVAIALDGSDGSLWVAYAQRRDDTAPNFSSAVAYVTNRGGSWSEPIDIPGSYENPLLAVTGGVIHLASEDLEAEDAEDLDDIFRPLYITNSTGDWAAVPVADRGRTSAFGASANGRLELILESWPPASELKTIYHATRDDAAGGFELTPLIEGLPRDSQVAGALDADGVPHLFIGEGFPPSVTYVRGLGGSQTDPEPAPFIPGSVAFDPQGALHAVEGDRYLSNVGGSFAAQSLACGCEPNDAGIAVDAGGRPHVVVSSRDGIWYAVGPAR